MKKGITLVFSALLLILLLTVSVFAAESSANYSDCFVSIVDGKPTATCTKNENKDGKNVLKIVPNPAANMGNSVTLDAYGLTNKGFDVVSNRYIVVEYYYECESPKALDKMKIMLSRNQAPFEAAVNVSSLDKIVANEWSIAVFNLGTTVTSQLKSSYSTPNIFQMHIYPYGSISSNKLSNGDVMYISTVTFTNENPIPDKLFKVSFDKGLENAEGEALVYECRDSEVITLPACPFTPNDNFIGWTIGTDTENIYYAGEPYAVISGDVSFIAKWKNGLDDILKTSYTTTKYYSNSYFVGPIDGHKRATFDKESYKDGIPVVKVVPNPAVENKGSVGLDSYNLDVHKIDITQSKYIIVDYYYDAPIQNANGRMTIYMSPNKSPFSVGLTMQSNEMITSGGWQRATFNIGSHVIKNLKAGYTSPYLYQMHLYPYGQSTMSTSLTTDDVMYIGKITFTGANPNPDATYEITFEDGAGGELGDEFYYQAKMEEVITIPECTYNNPLGEFLGWYMGTDTKVLYQPGDTYVCDGNLNFSALWKEETPEMVVLSYPKYHNSIIDGSRYYDNVLFVGEEEENGLKYIKMIPNPEAKTVTWAGFDGWSYKVGTQISLHEYNYAIMVYKFESDKTYTDITPILSITKRDNAITQSVMLKSEPLQMNKWSCAVFDLAPQKEYATEVGIISQMHVLPLGYYNITKLQATDSVKVAYIIFTKEAPTDLDIHSSFITGYADGTFKPSKTMTRAEASTVLTRLLTSENSIDAGIATSFTDVASDAWYYKYIAYLESKGVLSAFTGEFKPDKEITRGEFVDMIVKSGINDGKTQKDVSFNDVSADHPYYSSIIIGAKSGIINGYDNGDGTFSFKPDATITRAEVVKVINNTYSKNINKTTQPEELDDFPLFTDLDTSHWAYYDILEASVTHGNVDSENSLEQWIFSAVKDPVLDLEAGKQKVLEVDKLASDRIAEIRTNTSIPEASGTKYYVSFSEGSDDNDGKSPEAPFKTLSKVNNTTFAKGDLVLFKRGDLWRGEKLTTQQYVTYSAYGEGDKPKFYLSPENAAGAEKWTLVEGTTNVWKFYKELVDIGGVVINDGEGIFEKQVLFLKDGKFFTDEAATKIVEDIPAYLSTSTAGNLVCFNDVRSTSVTTAKGDFYVRCDEGNPGEIYKSLELLEGSSNIISASSDVTIDNLCLMYGGRHGIGGGNAENFKVTNCEIGWIGGCIMQWNVSGSAWKPARFGNGIELYINCKNFVIDNCYIYQVYDAGITHQYQYGSDDCIEEDVVFSNNVIEYCCYNIEYFMGVSSNPGSVRIMRNIEYSGNILRNAGFGWGRLVTSNSANIKGWEQYNRSESFVIKNNILDRASGSLFQSGAHTRAWLPKYENNTYIQYKDGTFSYYGKTPAVRYYHNSSVYSFARKTLGESRDNIFFVEKQG
ncbi:MAG: S-layer homology domain-containing protein [Clostridia bacterium]|nr:S-layer homology domain-containing protein [Clostridia bacterium]